MALQDLPLELFHMIVSHLDADADKQSLRVTCTAFKGFIPVFKFPRWHLNQPAPPFFYNEAQQDRRDFLERLFRPGNIFHNQESYMPCGGCLKAVSPAAFSPMRTKVDGQYLCNHCLHYHFLLSMPKGHILSIRHNYSGDDMSIKSAIVAKKPDGSKGFTAVAHGLWSVASMYGVTSKGVVIGSVLQVGPRNLWKSMLRDLITAKSRRFKVGKDFNTALSAGEKNNKEKE